MVPAVRSTFVAACVALLAAASMAEARQAPAMNPAVVSGANITFSWTATAGATSYRLQAGLAPGLYLATFDVGNVTSFAVTAPATGTFFARVVAITPAGDVPSLDIAVTVTSLVAPPAVPTNLTAARNGVGIVVTWSPGAGGSAPTGYRLSVDTAQGTLPISVGTNSFAFSPVPAGNYAFRVAAVNGGGASGDSADVLMTMPAGGACDAPPAPTLSTVAWGPFLTASWSAIPGASAYLLSYQGAGASGQIPFGGNTTRFLYSGLPVATWQFGVQAVFSCGQAGAVGLSTLVVDNRSLKLEPRTPDPAPGSALGSPGYILSVVRDLAARYPFDLRNSCLEHGGNNRWLFRLVEELRRRDKRWGLNWKRANVGDMSQDVVTYNWGDEGDEGTARLRAWDVIGGHCGPNPAGQATEITSPTPPGVGRDARWTLIPYIQAGFIP